MAVEEEDQLGKKKEKKRRKTYYNKKRKATSVLRDSSFLGTKDRRVKWYISVNPEAG